MLGDVDPINSIDVGIVMNDGLIKSIDISADGYAIGMVLGSKGNHKDLTVIYWILNLNFFFVLKIVFFYSFNYFLCKNVIKIYNLNEKSLNKKKYIYICIKKKIKKNKKNIISKLYRKPEICYWLMYNVIYAWYYIDNIDWVFLLK